jgi:cation diffusion facilitator CzcD-associated flavoprotein CzcO
MSDAVDVAIVGAGPYGLSIASHLRAAGVNYRQFGEPMRLWSSTMPKGMCLKSQGFASNLDDPAGKYTLEAFCAETGRPYASYGLPVALGIFVAYGRWFQAKAGLEVDEVLVTGLSRRGNGGFELTLSDASRVHASRVVIAIGVEAFAYLAEPLASLPSSVCSHPSAHDDLSKFRGDEVVVVGAGQSALETAALLHENGASVTLVARTHDLRWNGDPLPLERPLYQRMREPESGLGSGWATWFYTQHPELFRHLPKGQRVFRARTALGPAGASWLRPRVEGKLPIITGHTMAWAKPDGNGVRLGLQTPSGPGQELIADHIIGATGYRTDLSRLEFLDDQVRSGLRVLAGSPVVGADYQSTVPGLYFAGPAVAPSFGPVMRFVCGSRHAAGTVARQLIGSSARRSPAVAAAGR